MSLPGITYTELNCYSTLTKLIFNTINQCYTLAGNTASLPSSMMAVLGRKVLVSKFNWRL